MNAYETTKARLREKPRRWLVTGVAGFIGSNLLETLLAARPAGGRARQLRHRAPGQPRRRCAPRVSPERWARFRFVEGDVASPEVCADALAGVDARAAPGGARLGPALDRAAARQRPRQRPRPPGAAGGRAARGRAPLRLRVEQLRLRRQPAAAQGRARARGHCSRPTRSPSSRTSCTPASTASCTGCRRSGLRYFNVFGRRQDPEGAYAAVIPAWIAAMIRGARGAHQRHGRDQPRLLLRRQRRAGQPPRRHRREPRGAQPGLQHRRRAGARRSSSCTRRCAAAWPRRARRWPTRSPCTARSAPATCCTRWPTSSKARRLLGYEPTHSLEQGLDEALDWYEHNVI